MILRVLSALGSSTQSARLRVALDDPDLVLVQLGRGESPWERLQRENYDLFLTEARTLLRRGALTIGEIRALPDHPEVIVFAEEEPEERARLQAEGVMAVVYPDLPDEALRETLRSLVERRREDAMRRLQSDRTRPTTQLVDFTSASPAMSSLLGVVERVVDADSSLLILGETGVGKEHLARAIHAESRRTGPFLAVNCAALPESLLESELFGHVEGAFSGAVRARRGYFELAHRGTLFLDEITDLPLHLQVKLLRALQEKSIRRIGAEANVDVDVRLMAATNRNLAEEISAQRFRSDLYYRLAVVILTIPPLRERMEDLPDLVASYVERFRVKLKRPVTGVGPEAPARLPAYRWPGNVRELINVIERAVLLCTQEWITPADLPLGEGWLVPAPAVSSAKPVASSGTAGSLDRPWREFRGDVLGGLEERYFRALLERSGGRVGEAATRAGITPRFLYGKMQRFGLRKEEFKFVP